MATTALQNAIKGIFGPKPPVKTPQQAVRDAAPSFFPRQYLPTVPLASIPATPPSNTPYGPALPPGYIAPGSTPIPTIDYAAQRMAQDAQFERTLREALAASGLPTQFVDRSFDETGAEEEARALLTPDVNRRRTELTEEIGLDKRGTEEDYNRTAAELAQVKGVNTINQATRTTALQDTLGGQGTVRAGIGMRQAGLNTIRGIQDTEDVDRLGTNAGQIKNLALARADNRMNTGLGTIQRGWETDLATELQNRRRKFQESETKRRTDYSNDYDGNYSRALAKVYGGY